jgi:hypothetical protein
MNAEQPVGDFTNPQSTIRNFSPELMWATAVLLLMFALTVTSLRPLGATFDEQGFLVRGLGYLRGENEWMRVGHPLGLNALSAALLADDPTVALPTTDSSWLETSFHRPAELFLWEIGNDVAHILFVGRMPTIWLGLLLAALVGRWAWRISGRRAAGLLALALIALDPNILAHTRLMTTDLGLAFGAALAGAALWWFGKRPSWKHAIFAGAAFGLLQNSKFTAGLFVPLFAIVMLLLLLLQWQPQTPHANRLPLRTLLMLVVAYPLSAFFTLWLTNGFQIGTLPTELPTLPQLGGLTIPLAHHVEQLLDIGGRLQVSTPSFLWGQTGDSGWWYYFPVAFLLKTPLPTLILLATAVALRIHFYIQTRRARRSLRGPIFDDVALLVPALGYFAIALTSEINLGYRHLLPMLPFLAVFTANAWATFWSGEVRRLISLRIVTLASIGILAIIALRIHPYYLSYFNVLAGGSDGGWRYLVDSNLDWGQDLPQLADWMAENDVEEVWLSYFGEARPDYYGIAYRGLDSFPPRLMDPNTRPFYPHDPAPGMYAISATNLQGVHFANPDQFAWFREREPLDKIGYSIFLYEAPSTGATVDVVLAGVQIDELLPADFDQFNSNDVALRWIDPAEALIVPDSTVRWLVLAEDTAVSPILASLLQSWPQRVRRDGYTIYQIPPLDIPNNAPLAQFSQDAGEIWLMSALSGGTTAVPGGELFLSTGWLQQGAPQPLKLFIHLLDAQGEIVAQWDGLGAAWQGWQPGDALLHTHTLPLPADLPAGAYELRLGVYHPESGVRWQTADQSDAFSIGTVQIGE